MNDITDWHVLHDKVLNGEIDARGRTLKSVVDIFREEALNYNRLAIYMPTLTLVGDKDYPIKLRAKWDYFRCALYNWYDFIVPLNFIGFVDTIYQSEYERESDQTYLLVAEKRAKDEYPTYSTWDIYEYNSWTSRLTPAILDGYNSGKRAVLEGSGIE